jgi:hypothetical protein
MVEGERVEYGRGETERERECVEKGGGDEDASREREMEEEVGTGGGTQRRSAVGQGWGWEGKPVLVEGMGGSGERGRRHGSNSIRQPCELYRSVCAATWRSRCLPWIFCIM